MNASIFERWIFVVAVVVTIAFFFVPLVLIHAFDATVPEGLEGQGEATVGVAVILRATARRLLRSGSSNIMRTTMGAYSRAVGRAVTRRVVKVAVRTVAGGLTKQTVDDAADEDEDESEGPDTLGRSLLALVVGTVGLAVSFWGILLVVDAGVADGITTANGLGFVAACMLAAAPLAAYAVLNLLGGRWFGVNVSMRTEVDGLILQGYFTGAGSFLPMTTDFDYEGTDRARALVAAVALGGLYLLHLATGGLATALDSYALSFLSTMFLVYVFVYSFPIRPLEGSEIWRVSRLLWVLFWIPILWSFAVSLPTEFAEIL